MASSKNERMTKCHPFEVPLFQPGLIVLLCVERIGHGANAKKMAQKIVERWGSDFLSVILTKC